MCVVVSLVCVLAAPAALFAQSTPAPKDFDVQRVAMLGLFGGAISSDTGTGGAAGWAAGWQPTRMLGLEGGGWWTREPGVEGFAALFGPRFSFQTSLKLAPFVAMGVGLFHSEVDTNRADAPAFYTDRMEDPQHNTFNDFALAPSGGVEVRMSTHVMLRPELRVLMVTSGDGVRVSTMYGVAAIYNFLGKPAPGR